MKNTSVFIFRFLLLMAVFLWVVEQSIAQTPGTLDPTFGTAGLATIPPSSGPGFYYDMAVQPDGKIVIAGNIGTSNGLPFANVVRLTADGAPDPTFDGDGYVFSNLLRSTVVTVQPDGKILVGGFLGFSANNQGFVRLNSDGSPDTTLNGSGQVVTTIGTGFNVTSVKVQTDGKIVVAGTTTLTSSSQDFGVLRYNADGTLDTAFGTGGRVATDINGSDAAFDAFVQPDGKIIVAGHSTDILSNIRSATLVRYNSDGTLDTTFGSGGKLIRASGTNTSALKVAIQSDGKIIIVGNGILPLRFNPNGTLETIFQAADGFLYSGLAIQANGKIVISGGVTFNNGGNYNFSVLRYNSNGLLDMTFASGGRAVTAAAGNVAEDVVIQPSGKIVAAGTRYDSGTKIVLARYTAELSNRLLYDFDGDRRADVSLFRPSNGNWYFLPSATGNFYGFPFGQATDRIAPADYDGDGKTDVAVFRPVVPGAGDQAYFYILNSADNAFRAIPFGTLGDAPASGDWDGDGKGDVAVYRTAPPTGRQSSFYYRPSAQPSVNFNAIPLGTSDDRAVQADYDGDGRLDPAVFRPSSATWIILRSSLNQITQTAFGLATDIPVPADYDGDGLANIAVFRPSTGTWFTSQNPATNYGAVQFGANGDFPVPADYDGDGRTDTAVFRPSNGGWYLNRTTSGLAGVQFGVSGDKPNPNAYIR